MSVAPGWYDDGVTPAIQRWYDGAAWTEHTRAAPSPRGSAPSGWTTTGAAPGASAPGATAAGAMTAGAMTAGAMTAHATPGDTAAGSATSVPIEGLAPTSVSPAWPVTTALPVTTAWPVTPPTRGSLPTPAVSAAAVDVARSVAWGPPPEARPVAPSGDATTFGRPASSERYPEGWGPSGYEIGPERRRTRVRVEAEPATDWCVLPTGASPPGNALPGTALPGTAPPGTAPPGGAQSSGQTPGPWPLPGQPLLPPRRPGATPSDPMHWLIPVGRSWQSIVAGYLGLIGLLIWPLAPFAVWLGFWGRSLARVGGNGGGRATFAIVSGLVGTFVGVLVLMAALRG